MNTNIATPGMRNRFAKQYILPAVGAALAIAAVAGVGVWQASDGGDGAETPAATAVQPYTFTAGATEDVPTLYIVGSDEQAAAVRFGLDELNNIRATGSIGSVADDALVVGSAEDEENLKLAILETNAIRFALGLPEVEVVDLRTIK